MTSAGTWTAARSWRKSVAAKALTQSSVALGEAGIAMVSVHCACAALTATPMPSAAEP